MNNAVMGGSVALILGLTGIGAYVYVEQQKLQAAKVMAVASAPVAASAATSAVAPVPPVPAVTKALTDLYGRAASSNTLILSPTERTKLWFAQTFADGAEQVHVVFVARQLVNADGELQNASHAAGGSIDAITYKLLNNQWLPAFKQKAFVEVGSWGEPPEVKKADVIRLGNATALLIDVSYSGQGYTEEGKTIVALEPAGWRSLGFVETGADNSGTCEEDPKLINAESLPACWSYSGTISAGVTAPGKTYPDLNVQHVGTMADENRKPVPATPTVVKFNGTTYSKE